MLLKITIDPTITPEDAASLGIERKTELYCKVKSALRTENGQITWLEHCPIQTMGRDFFLDAFVGSSSDGCFLLHLDMDDGLYFAISCEVEWVENFPV